MDPTLPEHLKVIALEWRAEAPALASWAMAHLVNRDDRWVQFSPAPENEGRPYRAVTLPSRSRRGADRVSLDKLERHFGSFRRSNLIGLHATSHDGTCRWLFADIDLHSPDASSTARLAAANGQAARAWHQRLTAAGYDPLLLDSNGQGGYHLGVLFDRPYPVSDVYQFGEHLVADWQHFGLARRPELYPRSAASDSAGGALRLPGLHHYLDHITRVWSGSADGLWLEGVGAARTLLQNVPGPGPSLSRLPAAFVAEPRVHRLGRARPAQRAQEIDEAPGRAPILVDFDGVLAQYNGFKGASVIGPPLPGMLQFLAELRRRAPVNLFSSRMATPTGRVAIEAWLDRNGVTVDGLADPKPAALAIVDDRAVPCRPQVLGEAAYAAALSRIDGLTGRPGAHAQQSTLLLLLDAWPILDPDTRHRLRTILDEALAAHPLASQRSSG